ncbi:OLC1v1020247C1 [Oldenlandia corymbosa var. corymbosa]|uniref:OLC1v1020247C1 n=1 Tax=Oldenlandia corymbosa var. corymbosa TaxID=529605 RepID=A0AAV1EGD8_OLDCO|nr:OLC1v1020247C1 [Oldenlandia corymbosa var. corymbosa]
MASAKRIIAICQSGGGFATNEEDGSLYYSGGEAHALDLDQNTQLKDFKQELSETFECSVNGMAIKYFLPGNKKTLITVSKDKDLKRMFNFFKDLDQVEVFVIAEEQPVVARNVSNTPVSRSSRTTASEAVVPGLADDLFGPRDLGDVEMDDPINQSPLDSYPSGSEEQHRRAAIQWENLITGVDQRFNSFPEFREALHKYSIAHGFSYKYKKNDSHRVTVKCKIEGCPWRVHASRLATTQLICIKKMNPKHTCEGTSVKAGYRATRGWVANMIKEKLKVSPHYKPKDIAMDIKREYGIQLNYSQARRAKEIAREQLQGSHSEAYTLLPFFCEKIMETNPGSIAKFTTKEDSTFQRLFVAFHASISGFRACRPLIFLDSTLLYSKYQGTLLAATAADGNDGVFPVAFAVVDEETDDSWHWFLSELKSAVSTSRQITFVADLEKGISVALQDIFGDDCYHAYCLRYLAKKLNRDLKGQFSHEARRLMVQDLSSAAFAPKLDAFERCAENIKAISPEAYNWVVQSEPKNWANAFFPGVRYNHMTSNFGQLFHSWVSEAEELPITQMVDVLRGKMMEMIYTRRVESSQWTTRLCPLIEEKLQRESSKARSLQVIHSEGNTYHVSGESVEIVAIDRWDCSCKGWQLTGLPCCHAIIVLELLHRDPYDYCLSYFTTESYRATYAESINPMPNVEKPAKSELEGAAVAVTPPPVKRTPGRPKAKQTDTLDVIKRQLQCSKCKGLGHNKRACEHNGITEIETTGTQLLTDMQIEEPEGSA